MIKITFELSEEFIRESANADSFFEMTKAADGSHAMRALFNLMGFTQLKKPG